MKRLITALLLATSAIYSLPAAADVGVSVSIGQPGFYGQINIGGFPAPQLLYPQPVIVQPVPVAAPPIYLRVPPYQAGNWYRYCGQYRACGRPVFFVRDDWYNRVYVPQYWRQHDNRRGYEQGERHGNGHRDWRDEHHDNRRDNRRDYQHDEH